MSEMLRAIHTHEVTDADRQTIIVVTDQPGAGGANHEYVVLLPNYNGEHVDGLPKRATQISFQNGPVAEHGVNGITQEVLAAIIIDRLESFQAGPFASDYNAIALAHFRSGLAVLQQRTKDRIARNVEGRSVA